MLLTDHAFLRSTPVCVKAHPPHTPAANLRLSTAPEHFPPGLSAQRPASYCQGRRQWNTPSDAAPASGGPDSFLFFHPRLPASVPDRLTGSASQALGRRPSDDPKLCTCMPDDIPVPAPDWSETAGPDRIWAHPLRQSVPCIFHSCRYRYSQLPARPDAFLRHPADSRPAQRSPSAPCPDL